MVDTTGQSDVDYYYAHDHLYNTAVLIDTNGDVVERYEYDAYGNVHIMDGNYNSRSSTLYDNPYTFTGRRYDSLDDGDGSYVKLYYYRARYYKPDIGRFLQTDPIGYHDSMNLYQYCGNNPVNFVDPLGEWKPPEHRNLTERAMVG